VNNIPEIEIALRNGLIDELASQTNKSVEIIKRLISVVNAYQETIDKAIQQNRDMMDTLAECVEQRDRARATAVRLEQECHSCADTVHHGNEEVYDGAI
jgi:chromosome segregation ATPase